MTQISPRSAIMTLTAYGLVVVAAIVILVWIFTRSPANEASSVSPTSTPLPQGSYNIDAQLDMLSGHGR